MLVLEGLSRACEAPLAHDLANRLMTRRLLRRTVALPLHKRKGDLGGEVLSRIRDSEYFDAARISEIEEAIGEAIDVDPHLVAFALDARTNPTYRRPGGAARDKDILFALEEGPPSLLEWESEIFRETSGEEHVWANLYTPPLDDAIVSAVKEQLWQARAQV